MCWPTASPPHQGISTSGQSSNGPVDAFEVRGAQHAIRCAARHAEFPRQPAHSPPFSPVWRRLTKQVFECRPDIRAIPAGPARMFKVCQPGHAEERESRPPFTHGVGRDTKVAICWLESPRAAASTSRERRAIACGVEGALANRASSARVWRVSAMGRATRGMAVRIADNHRDIRTRGQRIGVPNIYGFMEYRHTPNPRHFPASH